MEEEKVRSDYQEERERGKKSTMWCTCIREPDPLGSGSQFLVYDALRNGRPGEKSSTVEGRR